MKTKIGFIGGGNMAHSLIGGMVSQDFSAANILVHDPGKEKLAELADTFHITVSDSNQALLDSCDTIVLAVKPQLMKSVLEPLAFTDKQLVISIAAGLRCRSLEKWIGNEKTALIRTMPNTPALVQQGATGMYANSHVTSEQKNLAETLMLAVGVAIWVEQEDLLDTVTALSGSGPAYYFYVMEAMQEAAIEMGLAADAARLLTIQTALGAAVLAAQSKDNPGTLRKNVTSPGGTTEQAIQSFDRDNLRQIIGKAMRAAYDRSQALANELDN